MSDIVAHIWPIVVKIHVRSRNIWISFNYSGSKPTTEHDIIFVKFCQYIHLSHCGSSENCARCLDFGEDSLIVGGGGGGLFISAENSKNLANDHQFRAQNLTKLNAWETSIPKSHAIISHSERWFAFWEYLTTISVFLYIFPVRRACVCVSNCWNLKNQWMKILWCMLHIHQIWVNPGI